MDLAVDAARSRHLPDFLKRFAARAASLANADWGGVVVFEENAAEFYSGTELADVPNSPTRDWLVCKALEINGRRTSLHPAAGKKFNRCFCSHPIEFERANGCGMPAAAPARAART